MQKAGYSFYNIPRKFEASDYRKAISRIIGKYSRIKSLLAIYDWGNPSAPGVSDIDIVLVFEEEADALPVFSRSFYLMDAETRYLARHPFMFIDKNSFSSIRHIYPDASLELLHGEKIKINKVSQKEKYCINTCLLNDIIIRHYPRDFILQQLCRRINARDTLLRLNSLKYSVRILENLTKERNRDWNELPESVESLRKNWFKQPDYKRLAGLNNDAVKMTLEIAGKFSSFLTGNNLVKIDSGNNLRYNGIKNKTLFIKDWGREAALKEMSKNEGRKGFHSILPIELAAQLFEYSRQKGLISSYIRNNLGSNLTYRLKHKDVIRKRIGIINRQAMLACRLKHSDFAAFFDFGYRNKAGINNLIISFMDRLRF